MRCWQLAARDISIHALLAESDYDSSVLMKCQVKFLSTLSLRRATIHYDNYNLHCVISIHALLAESDPAIDVFLAVWAVISIHALLAESDARRDSRQQPAGISIHALLAESDSSVDDNGVQGYHFYPRSPCGERPITITITCIVSKFLSTLSLRRATVWSPQARARKRDFYPRSPCGERPKIPKQGPGPVDFYPRSPCGERPPTYRWQRSGIVFLSTLSLRRATVIISFHPRADLFLSTLSLRRATASSTWATLT